MSIFGTVLHFITERGARNLTIADLEQRLTDSGKIVNERFMAAADTDGNKEAINHMTGIERWGQRRLKVALGEESIMDEYDGYRLSNDSSLAELQAAFQSTRQDTLAIAKALQEANVPATMTIEHNELGPLTVRGWLYYLNAHASRERNRVRTI